MRRFHSGFGTFQSPIYYSNSFTPRTVAQPGFVSARPVSLNVAGGGWNHLSKGQFASAKNVFASDIKACRSTGAARVGYSLASASLGDSKDATWAMKRAFVKDNATVPTIMIDDDVRETAERVTRMYEDRLTANEKDMDAAFMLAALYQMQGDPEMAMMAMEKVKSANAMDQASKYLDDLIESEMKSIPMNTSLAWKTLENGDSQAAAEAFVKEIIKDENDGVAKLGFALASADLGDLDKGVWAVRRAFKVDADRVSDVMISGKIRPLVQRLEEAYAKRSMDADMKDDDAYMLAVLSMLQGDLVSAEMFVDNSNLDAESFVVRMVKEEMKMQEMLVSVAEEKMDAKDGSSFNEMDMMDEKELMKLLSSPVEIVDRQGQPVKSLALENSTSPSSSSGGSGSKADLPGPPVPNIIELPSATGLDSEPAPAAPTVIPLIGPSNGSSSR